MDSPFELGETCPQCGGVALLRFEPEDRGLWFSCALCGFEREYMQPFEAPVDSSQTTGAPCMNGLNYRPVLSPQCEPGFGAWGLTFFDGSTKSGQANCPVTPETFRRWKEHLLDPTFNPDESYLTSWNQEAGTLGILHGSAELIERLRKTGK
jgi:hypothetical protein